MTATDRQRLWTALQFTVSVVIGCLFVWWYNLEPGYNRKGGILGGFLLGIAANYCLMFLITWARFGWRAARSMRMLG